MHRYALSASDCTLVLDAVPSEHLPALSASDCTLDAGRRVPYTQGEWVVPEP